MNKNFNNISNARYFDYRIDTRKTLPISTLKLDYDLKIGGYTYLPNTPFKTVLNKIAYQLNNPSAGGIYDGSGTIPANTVAKIASGTFTIDYSTDADDIKVSNTGNNLTLNSADGTGKIIIKNGQSSIYTANYSIDAKDGTGITIYDNAGSPKGMSYAADYSANYTSRSLVDKAYVDGKCTSGTYTPSVTNVTNIQATTPRLAQYLRVGNTVTVSGSIEIDPTATGASAIRLTIPVASNFANDYDCGGTFSTTTGVAGAISADAATDTVTFNWNAGVSTNDRYYYTFTYKVI